MPQPGEALPRRTRSIRDLYCRSLLPPFANEPDAPLGIEPPVVREGSGDMVISDNLDRAWSFPETGVLGFDCDAHQISDSRAGGTDSGTFRDTVLQRVTLAPLAIGPQRLRITMDCVVDVFHHRMRRYPVPPLPHSSTLDWRTEAHVYLPDTGEVLKFPLGHRSLNGGTRFDRQVDILPPGTRKTFTATTASRYRMSQPLLLRFGLWTEFRATSRQMRIDTMGKLRLSVLSLQVCLAG